MELSAIFDYLLVCRGTWQLFTHILKSCKLNIEKPMLPPLPLLASSHQVGSPMPIELLHFTLSCASSSQSSCFLIFFSLLPQQVMYFCWSNRHHFGARLPCSLVVHLEQVYENTKSDIPGVGHRPSVMFIQGSKHWTWPTTIFAAALFIHFLWLNQTKNARI